MKTANNYLEEANKLVSKINVNDAIEKHKEKSAIFIDVRDSAEIERTGTILEGLKIPRGFIEFAADETHPLHNKALKRNSEIILICGAGGQAALAGKTLIEMGYQAVLNVGGISDWEKNGGPMNK
jgi:rhodanese-related sulfurtransferase